MTEQYTDETIDRWSETYRRKKNAFNREIMLLDNGPLKDIFIILHSILRQIRIHLECIAIEMHKHTEEVDDDEA